MSMKRQSHANKYIVCDDVKDASNYNFRHCWKLIFHKTSCLLNFLLTIGQIETWTVRQLTSASHIPQPRRWLSRVLWNSIGYIRRSGKERCRLRPGRPHAPWRLFHRGEVYSYRLTSISFRSRCKASWICRPAVLRVRPICTPITRCGWRRK